MQSLLMQKSLRKSFFQLCGEMVFVGEHTKVSAWPDLLAKTMNTAFDLDALASYVLYVSGLLSKLSLIYENKPTVYTTYCSSSMSKEEKAGVDHMFEMMMASKQQLLLKKAMFNE